MEKQCLILNTKPYNRAFLRFKHLYPSFSTNAYYYGTVDYSDINWEKHSTLILKYLCNITPIDFLIKKCKWKKIKPSGWHRILSCIPIEDINKIKKYIPYKKNC